MKSKVNTIVIKIGSSLLVDEKTGHVQTDFLYKIVKEIKNLRDQDFNVVLVSSGAVALGKKFSNIPPSQKLTLAEKQAAAALGQPELMSAYQYLANEYKFRMPQVLLTLHDFENRKHFLNAEETLKELLKQKTVPIINENDTVATQELKIGDNDRIAAKVAHLVQADTLIILTDVNGLWDKDKQIIRTIEKLDQPFFDLAGGASGSGSGGMITKLQAAEIAAASGCTTHIASGHGVTPITNALTPSNIHTTILSETTPRDARKLWISTSLGIQGEIILKPESLHKTRQGKAILPSDIESVIGEFNRGDTISITYKDQEIARGLTLFYKYEIDALIENQSLSIFEILGYDTTLDIITEKNLVLM